MSLFGNTSTTGFGQTSGLFSKPAGQTSIFGQPAAQQQPQQQQQQQTGSIFGASQPAQAQNTQQPAGSLFGPAQPTQTAGLFQSQQQQQLQQQSQFQPSNTMGGSLWKPGSLSNHQKTVPEQIQAITNKWDPSNPACEFKTYFYNKVEEASVPFYVPSATDDALAWEEALASKPAQGFIPVAAVGFAALAQRLHAQRKAVGQFNLRLHEINASLDAILGRHDLETSVRALNARRRHAELRRRSLALAARVQVLRNRGYALSGDEDDLRTKLAALERSVQDPALSARLEELWSRLITLRDYAQTLQGEISKGCGLPEGQGGLGEEVEAKAKKILEDYDKQIQHLKKEVELIKKDFEEWEKQNSPVTPKATRS